MTVLEHIGLDVDCVLRDIMTYLVQVFAREHPALAEQVTPLSEWTTFWEFHHYFPPEARLREFTRRHRHEIWLDSPLYPGTLEALERLSSSRTLHVVTAQSNEELADLTRQWIRRHELPFPDDRVHMMVDKEKAPVQVLVDDLEYNLEAVQAVGIIPICYAQPWNQGWSGWRIRSLQELPELLLQIEALGAIL